MSATFRVRDQFSKVSAPNKPSIYCDIAGQRRASNPTQCLGSKRAEHLLCALVNSLGKKPSMY